jgi:hypothetical protein
MPHAGAIRRYRHVPRSIADHAQQRGINTHVLESSACAFRHAHEHVDGREHPRVVGLLAGIRDEIGEVLGANDGQTGLTGSVETRMPLPANTRMVVHEVDVLLPEPVCESIDMIKP